MTKGIHADVLSTRRIGKDFLPDANVMWQNEVVYDAGILKLWLSSPPQKRKQGTRYEFVMISEASARPMIMEFARLACTHGGRFLYNKQEGLAKVILTRTSTFLFENFLKMIHAGKNSPVSESLESGILGLSIIHVYY